METQGSSAPHGAWNHDGASDGRMRPSSTPAAARFHRLTQLYNLKHCFYIMGGCAAPGGPTKAPPTRTPGFDKPCFSTNVTRRSEGAGPTTVTTHQIKCGRKTLIKAQNANNKRLNYGGDAWSSSSSPPGPVTLKAGSGWGLAASTPTYVRHIPIGKKGRK